MCSIYNVKLKSGWNICILQCEYELCFNVEWLECIDIEIGHSSHKHTLNPIKIHKQRIKLIVQLGDTFAYQFK